MILIFLVSCVDKLDLDWSVAALYDLAPMVPEGATAAWAPSAAMLGSCCPVRHPQGLGLMEAEALATGRSPTLVVLLKQERMDAPVLDSSVQGVVVQTRRSASSRAGGPDVMGKRT